LFKVLSDQSLSARATVLSYQFHRETQVVKMLDTDEVVNIFAAEPQDPGPS
jgi:hypothetical protein